VHDCGPGLKCHHLLSKCVNSPPMLGQVCDADAPCALGLNCDTTVRRCVEPVGAGGHCHPLGAVCFANMSCDATRAQCFHKPRWESVKGGRMAGGVEGWTAA
jgi:hypothetical protein